MGKKYAGMFKARHRYKALAFLGRGMTVDMVVKELQSRYHPNVSLGSIKKAYFPVTSTYALAGLKGASREKIIERMKKISANRIGMRNRHKDPKFQNKMREINSETMRNLHNSPDFKEKQRKGASRRW
ncbi:hypothetical protein KKG83_08080 [Candidatus Micrarchaeota archaeon]|nr:hypothetical protein [Candidatus Micrarchaeota archaeon]MBU2477399.1 hypothetical protein [Candidatus Micrarchaeota archaeon]